MMAQKQAVAATAAAVSPLEYVQGNAFPVSSWVAVSLGSPSRLMTVVWSASNTATEQIPYFFFKGV